MFVYIAEAHAVDEWPVGHPVHICQPKSTMERICTAQVRLEELGVRDEFLVLVDWVWALKDFVVNVENGEYA